MQIEGRPRQIGGLVPQVQRVVRPYSEPQLTQADLLAAHLIQRQGDFLYELRNVAESLKSRPGWLKTDNGGMIFTGSGLCGLSSAALKDGLVASGQIRESDASIIGVYAPIPSRATANGINHMTLRIEVPEETLFVDGTYGQVDLYGVDRIIVTRASAAGFGELYPAGHNGRNTPDSLGNPILSGADIVKAMRTRGLTPELYDRLVSTLK